MMWPLRLLAIRICHSFLMNEQCAVQSKVRFVKSSNRQK